MAKKSTIGIVEFVTIGDHAVNVPAKIDTGADSSSIWASDISVGKDGKLRFCLFGPGSEFYDGKPFTRSDFSVSSVKNSTGHSEIRYRTHFTVAVGGRRIKALFNLSDRSNNTYKILIGRRTISGKFLVDVSKHSSRLPVPKNSRLLRRALLKDPHKFHALHKSNAKSKSGESK
jgi:hypothetical protein